MRDPSSFTAPVETALPVKSAQPINHFHLESFVLNVVVYVLLIAATILAHYHLVVRKGVIRVFDFRSRSNSTLRTFAGLWDNLLQTFWLVATFSADAPVFVQKFGFTAFNFLNFQIKSAFAMLLLSLFSLLSGLLRYGVAGEPFSVWSYLTGTADFGGLLRLTTANAFFGAGVWAGLLFLLHKESRHIHLKVFLQWSTLDSRLALVPHVVYLSHLPSRLGPRAIGERIAEGCGLRREEFLLTVFPRMPALYRVRFEIDVLSHRLKNERALYWAFYKRTPERQAALRGRLEELRGQYRREMAAPLEFGDRGLICFEGLPGLERFLRWRVQDRSLLSLARRMVGAKSALESALLGNEDRTFRGLKRFPLFSYNDLIFKNLDVKLPAYFAVRAGLYGLLVLIMVFLTTPMAMVQMVLGTLFEGGQGADVGFQIKSPTARWLINLGLPLMICSVNLTILVLIDQIGRQQRFARFSLLQGYIFRVAFIYLLVNMFVIPGFSIGTAKSIFHMLVDAEVDFNHLVYNLKVYSSSNVISLVILQSGAVGFFIVGLCFSDAVLNRFDYAQLLHWLAKVRRKAYRKQEGDLFEFGYYYGYDTVILFMVTVFGLYQPLITVSGLAYFGLKTAANIISLTHYYKEQIYARTKLVDMALNRLKFAPALAFLVLALKCFYNGFRQYFWLHFAAFVMAATLAWAIKIKSFDAAYLLQPMNFVRFGEVIRGQVPQGRREKNASAAPRVLRVLHGQGHG